MVEQIYQDPVAFAQSFENASPVAVQSVIDMITGLITEGIDKKNALIGAHEDAVEASSIALDAMVVARNALEVATGERIEADDRVTNGESTLAQKQSAERAALGDRNGAQNVLDSAQSWMDSEVTRVDSEKGALTEVLQILDSIPDTPEGRRLLSKYGSLIPVGMIANVAKADPAAVQEVVDLVNALIEAGEVVRGYVTESRDTAATVLADATTQWKWAVSRTVEAQDVLAEREGEAEALLAVQREKWTVHDGKEEIHTAAVADEDTKKKEMDDQVPILDHENEQLSRVNEILNGLL